MAAPSTWLSISQLVRLFNEVLEDGLGAVSFEGEISQPTVSANGHLYFTIKDAESQISAVMWRSNVVALRFKPAQGVMVQCVGRAGIYPKSGRFQVVVQRMQVAGEGALQKRFLELKAKLSEAGFFSPERKRALPFLPRAVGVVTSGTGAVIHDFMVRIRERMPSLIVYLVDVRVQGPGAAEEIAAAVDRLSVSGRVDVIVVARGGGSLEDLWAFNEEVVVRAIFRAKVPVVSGVGHEVDVTLSDLVADVRAPTPTAAAEMVVPRREELLRELSNFESRLRDLDRWFAPRVQEFDLLTARLLRASTTGFERAKLRLDAGVLHLRALEPTRLLASLRERLASLEGALMRSSGKALTEAASTVDYLAERIRRSLPRERLQICHTALDQQAHRLRLAMSERMYRTRAAVEHGEGRLEALNPLKVLARGYAVIESARGVVSDSDELAVGSEVRARFHRGEARAVVTEIMNAVGEDSD